MHLRRRNLWAHRGHYWPIAAALAMVTLVLAGSLSVGHSLRRSLAAQADRASLGARAYIALRSPLREDALARAGSPAGMLRVDGSARRAEGNVPPVGVRFLGVDASLAKVAADVTWLARLAPGEVAINAQLAAQAKLSPGDEIIARLPKGSDVSSVAFPGVAPGKFSGTRLRVALVLGPAQGAELDERALPSPAPTVFLPLPLLQRLVGLEGRVNWLLFASPSPLLPDLRLTDLVHTTATLPAGEISISSEDVFLGPQAGDALMARPGAKGVLGYLVNDLVGPAKSAPYSIVAGTDALPEVANLGDDQVLVNQFLADDLGLAVGSPLVLKYYTIGKGGGLLESSARFTVAGVKPMEGPWADPGWMPSLSGIDDKASCRDWETAIPMDMGRIRPVDEDYWHRYRGTPKAWLSLKRAQSLWGGSLGKLTSVRLPAGSRPDSVMQSPTVLRELGWVARGIREDALAREANLGDVTGLFVGVSSFVVISAGIICWMLLAQALAARRMELRVFRVLGFGSRFLVRMLLGEAVVVVVPACMLGALLSPAYTWGCLALLRSLWPDGSLANWMAFHLDWASLAASAGAVALLSGVAVYAGLRRAIRGSNQGDLPDTPRARSGSGLWRLLGSASLALALAAASWLSDGMLRSGLFMATGFCVLLVCAELVGGAVSRRAAAGLRSSDRLGAMAWRGLEFWRSRTRAVTWALGSSVFIVLAIGANRFAPSDDPRLRTSGTGGFSQIAQVRVPLNPAIAPGGAAYWLDPAMSSHVVPIRIKPGDEAGCRNLAAPASPMVWGIPSQALEQRGAFTLEQMLPGMPPSWAVLREDCGGAIPVLADALSLQWSLKLKPGDRVRIYDEADREIELLIVGQTRSSILQGGLIMDQDRFASHFPSYRGASILLLEGNPAEWTGALDAVADHGLGVDDAAGRLAMLKAVEQSYLQVFLAIGSLALLLGVGALAAAVRIDLVSRRGESAILLAMGWPVRAVSGVILREYLALTLISLAAGGIAAAVALTPILLEPGRAIAWGWLLAVPLAAGGLARLLLGRTVKLASGDLVSTLGREG